MTAPGGPGPDRAPGGPETPRVAGARYVHTNLVARDWRALEAFYVDVLGCERVGDERRLEGPELEQGTGLAGAALEGRHLRLPGHGPDGPTLELFTYRDAPDRGPIAVHRPGFGHIAFAVDDVRAARDAVLAAGGRALGDVTCIQVSSTSAVTFTYVTDPEGNILELQSWSRRCNSPGAVR